MTLRSVARLANTFSHIWVGWHVIALALLLTGCATKKDAFEGSYWAEADSGKPALCFESGKCFVMSDKDWEYFQKIARETGQ